MYAVVRVGGTQHIVEEGQILTVPRLTVAVGSTTRLEEVLLVRDNGNLRVGNPTVAGAWVEATVIEHGRSNKVTTYKFIRRENYRRKKGHRQLLTRLKVTSIRVSPSQ
ncbi:MAG: 50S ribosomal protein L21 [candidate division WOR-3 bacterium]